MKPDPDIAAAPAPRLALDVMVEADSWTGAIADLEKSVGRPVLVDILKSYMTNAAELLARIEAAAPIHDSAEMEQAARDLAGASSGLGLLALTAAARELSQAARRGADGDVLLPQVKSLGVLTEATHRKLAQLYPDAAAGAEAA